MARDQPSARDRLLVPISAVITLMWIASVPVSIIEQQPLYFELATGQFTLLAGFVFGVRFLLPNGKTNGG